MGFEIKDLENLMNFLPMKLARSKERIFENQHKYVLGLPSETGIFRCKVVETSTKSNIKLRAAKAKDVVNKE